MKIRLVANKAVILGEMPEIVELTSDELPIEISNFSELKGRLSLRIYYDGGNHKDIEIRKEVFTIPTSILIRDVEAIQFTLFNTYENGQSVCTYTAPVEKFKIKGLVNVAEKDKLLDLLTVLYNKYVELEKKYEKLDNLVNQGDLLI